MAKSKDILPPPGVDPEFQSELPQVPEDQVDEPGIIATEQVVGTPFSRRPAKNIPPLTRRVRIVRGIDTKTGKTVHVPISKVPEIQAPADLPKISIAQAKTADIADESGAALTTVLKHGSSTSGPDLDEQIRQRGGNPDHKIAKTGGWGSQKEMERTLTPRTPAQPKP